LVHYNAILNEANKEKMKKKKEKVIREIKKKKRIFFKL